MVAGHDGTLGRRSKSYLCQRRRKGKLDSSVSAKVKTALPIWAQSLAIALLATALALVANTVHPQGLDLSRNYFPSAPEHPFQVIDLEMAQEYAQYIAEGPGGFAFLDARKEESYQDNHIPGALVCDHYQQDRFIPGILPRLAEAMVIVIYCTGGNCEDSIKI